jgi:hypothetical protein
MKERARASERARLRESARVRARTRPTERLSELTTLMMIVHRSRAEVALFCGRGGSCKRSKGSSKLLRGGRRCFFGATPQSLHWLLTSCIALQATATRMLCTTASKLASVGSAYLAVAGRAAVERHLGLMAVVPPQWRHFLVQGDMQSFWLCILHESAELERSERVRRVQ